MRNMISSALLAFSTVSVAAQDVPAPLPSDPNGTRLLFGPTARTLGQGQGHAGVFELFLPFVSYGVLDRVTLSAGSPIVPGEMGQVFYVAPKGQLFSSSHASVAIGGLALFSADDEAVGAGYAVGTFGGADHALTAAAGWGFAGGALARKPVVMLGGETRVHARAKLVSENYVASGGTGLASLGVRLIGDRLSADFGIGMNVGRGAGECCLPLVNVVYNFGKRR